MLNRFFFVGWNFNLTEHEVHVILLKSINKKKAFEIVHHKLISIAYINLQSISDSLIFLF